MNESLHEPEPIGNIFTKELKEKYPGLFSDTTSNEPFGSSVKTESFSQNTFNEEMRNFNSEDENEGPCNDDVDSEISDTHKKYSKVDHDIDHSVFELNFSEFPIAHLTNRLPKGTDRHKIQYVDHIRGRDGVLVERKWTIKSSADHGLGGPSSINVLFELMQVWKEQGFAKDKIYIGTYYNLLKRLGWDTNGASYKRLEDDLQSIYGLEIIAENAYYDKTLGKYVDKKFKPFIGWEFYKDYQIKDYMTDYGYIRVDPEFFSDFKRKSLYYLPFESKYLREFNSHEQKLALYLTKIFNPYRNRIQFSYKRNIYELCDQLNIPGTSNPKKKFYLLKAAKSLIRKTFILLDRFEVEGDSIVFYNRLQQSLLPFLNPKTGQKSSVQVDLLVGDIMNICNDKHSIDFYKVVASFVPDDIIYECLSESKQEGKSPKKLFTFLVMTKAKKYLEPFINKKNSDENESSES